MKILNDFEKREITDDEIRVIGQVKPSIKSYEENIGLEEFLCYNDNLPSELWDNIPPQPHTQKLKWKHIIIWTIVVLAVIAIALYFYFDYRNSAQNDYESYFESVESTPDFVPVIPDSIKLSAADTTSLLRGFTEIKDITVNDIDFKIYIPHNGEMSLHLGPVNWNDTTIIYAAQAADVRADNGGIVGAFVLKGEPKAWGLSKKGFVASINGEVTVGVAENSPLFEKATECGGYFFRQYPLVKDGQIVPNKVRGKSYRRAICVRNNEIFMVETMSKESFFDFSLALVDMAVDQAVYLVGSTAAGWAVDANDSIHVFGDPCRYTEHKPMPQNISYMVWRRR